MKLKYKYLILFKILICLNILFPQNLSSQNFIDIVSTGSSYIPKDNYKDTTGSFKFLHNYFNIQYPHVFANKDIFNAKLSVNHYNIKDTSSLNLYVAYLQLGLIKNLTEKSSMRCALYAEIASQLKDVTKNDFLIPIVAIYQYKVSEDFTYGVGLMYSKEFFGHFLVPMLHAKWRINDSWFFYADFPSYGYLMYYPKKTFRTGIYVSSTTSSIRLSEKYNNNYIQKSNTDFSLFFDLYFTKSIVLRAKAGYSSMRSLDVYKNEETVPFTLSMVAFNDKRIQLNHNIKGAPFFELSLNYRFHY